MDELILINIYRRQRLQFALSKLPDNYQRLAVVLWLMGWRQYEIAEIYHCSKSRVQQICGEFVRRNGLRYLN